MKFLSGGQRAEVAIGRTLVEKPIIIVMDEPTAPLSVEAAKRVLALIRDLKKGGCSIILISHRLDDVIEVSDRIMVLWRGRRVVCKEKEKLSKGQVVHYMMGVESAETSSN